MKWKKRVNDLINPESAKVLVACIPELRRVLDVNIESLVAEIGLTSGEASVRLKSIIASMFQTFAVRSKVQTHKLLLTPSHVSLH